MSDIDSVARGLAVRGQSMSTGLMRASRTQGLSIVSRIAGNASAGTGTVTTGGTIAVAMRIRHQNLTGKHVGSIAYAYGHWAPASQTEGATPYQLQVKASVEPLGTASDMTTYKPQPLFIGGLRVATLDRLSVVYTQEAPVSIDAGAYFYERTAITSPTSGATYPRHQIARGTAPGVGTNPWGISSGEGAATSDLVDNGSFTVGNSSGFSSSLCLGRLVDGTIAKSIILVSDSIGVGVDDEQLGPNSGGWFSRAFANIPGGNLAIAGEKFGDVISGVNFVARFELSKWSTHILCGYGRNDLGVGTALATIKANALAFAYKFMARGQHFVQATILPSPTSTDGWLTVANQAKEARDADRVAFNDWVRDTSSTGFVAQANAQVASLPLAGSAGFCDPCAGYECNAAGALTIDGGYILPVQGAVLATGTVTAVSGNTHTDSTKAWAVDAYAGLAVYVTGGTGAGQLRTIQSNTATSFTVGIAFSPVLDTTSTYRIADAIGLMDNVHPASTGHRLAAASIDTDAVMAVGD